MPEPTTPVENASTRREEGPSSDYLAALKQYRPDQLHAILDAIGPDDRPARTGSLASRIADRLALPEALSHAMEGLGPAPLMALRLFALTERASIPADGLSLALRLVGVEPAEAVMPLRERGLIASAFLDLTGAPDFSGRLLEGPAASNVSLSVHPSAASAVPPVVPEGDPPPTVGKAGSTREADGLEPILRLAALWQRLAEAPLRQTQQGSLFKRDRERLTEDPALVGPIADAVEPLPDLAWLWLALAEAVGLVVEEPGGDRINAATADYWAEHAVHLPQMLGNRWLGLQRWHEVEGWPERGSATRPTILFVRPAALLWLARLDEGEWVALDDLAARFDELAPGWDRRTLDGEAAPPEKRRAAKGKESAPPAPTLHAILLGPAYQLGLVRVAEAMPGRRRVVQLTPLGRYVLGLGPPPPPRETFEQFLFVQPNFEVIAYRQGLNPWLIGLFSRFLRWTQLGAALELKLTAESVYQGLEGGLTSEQILGRLERHSGRALPSGVSEALKTWSGRRARLTFFTSSTLVEFADPADLETALADWARPDDVPEPVRVTDRLLLVSDESMIPLGRIRLSGSRDYRRPPEPCVKVGPDGVDLAIDLSRSDLFVEAELARLADEEAATSNGRAHVGEAPRRRFRISRRSLARALSEGMTPSRVERWFTERTGSPAPPAVRLLLRTVAREAPPTLRAARPIVLQTPDAETLDGLLQHPTTAPLLGERLGPTGVVVPEGHRASLRKALSELGLDAEGLDTG